MIQKMMGKANKRKKLLTMLQNKVRKGGMAGLMGARIKKKEFVGPAGRKFKRNRSINY